jgi:exodeoxyribonuclease VIII
MADDAKVAEISAKLNEELALTALDPPEPGLHANVANDAYHRWRGASQSRLLTLRDRSPAHMQWQMEHPEEATPAMRLGAAVHTAVLEPDVFLEQYMCDAGGDGRSKVVKERRAKLREEYPDRTFMRPDDFDTCMAVREAVAAHPIAKALLDGPTERSAVWVDEESGVVCKARFDQLTNGVPALTDLKTTTDASPEAFARAIYKYGYYIQGSHYISGAQELGLDARFFTIIAVEKAEPYGVAIYHLRDDAIKAGEEELRPLLERWAECEASGRWPGYPEQAVEISLPPWAWGQVDERTGRIT